VKIGCLSASFSGVAEKLIIFEQYELSLILSSI
jgi:hypothetical protein